MSKLPRRCWGNATGIFELLQNMAKVRVTGGWLRDRLLESQELNPKAREQWQRLRHWTSNSMGDLDLVVSDRSTAELFEAVNKDVAFKSLLRRPPLLVPQKYGRAATLKLILPEAAVDITSLSDRYMAGGMRDDDELLKEDCIHRDITFNAMYLEVETEHLYDPTGGMSDLAAGVVRSPHTNGPKASFLEDPVRLLRLLRFAARFDFQLHSTVLDAAEDLQVHEALMQLTDLSKGRVLFEVKKDLLLHNQPWRFLEFCGICQVEELIFGPNLAKIWPKVVGHARRLGHLLLHGLSTQQLLCRSERFRGRHLRATGLPAPLLMPDWRKLGVWENDWLELLLGAMTCSLDTKAVQDLCQDLQLSKPMCDNVLELQMRSRQHNVAAHTQPPGVHLLRSATSSAEAFEDFWQRWPVAPGDV